ncbi:F-box only protein 44-like isoform X2 [Rhineura floridana]|uniref:F-box only protein 44-like isoform X2 n=1 Tax=Rhineura floridana TaxID=261503 RepID=UPI002AC86DF5|nr:F-box only protein 44-like isoform X2 [Rhineura floridana]
MATIDDLPPEILLYIFRLFPSWCLVRCFRWVCCRWRNLVDALNAHWKDKCERAGYPLAMLTSPSPDWEIFHLLCQLRKNIVKNPCGKEFLHWKINEHQERCWTVVELSKEEYPLEHVATCFIAFNGPDTKSQRITLKDHGYSDELMDYVRPHIVVQDWSDVLYPNPRYNYVLTVKLLSADFKALYTCFISNGEVMKNGTRNWKETSYTFRNYTAGIRHIQFEHGVDDGKLSNSTVTIGPNFP